MVEHTIVYALEWFAEKATFLYAVVAVCFHMVDMMHPPMQRSLQSAVKAALVESRL